MQFAGRSAARDLALVKFRLHQDYPTTLARLWAAFGRADYPEQKYRALGSTAVHILRFDVTESLIEVVLERTAPVAMAQIPAWARAFIGSEQRLRHYTRWRRLSPTRVRADLDIAPVGLPVSAHATGSAVEQSADLTRLTLTFDVTCRLPGFGAPVARLFAQQVQAALRADHAFTLRYLARS